MNNYKKINYINGSEPSISAENLNHMDDGIEAATAAITKIETDIATKANTTDVNAALSTKADKTSVDSALALKQDKSNMFSTKQNLTNKESSYPSIKYLENYYYDMDYVDDELALKANFTDVNTSLAKKANTVDVNAALALKANSADVEAALVLKADRATTDEIREDLDKLNSGSLIIKDNVIKDDINNWLNEHPEATTTVQDGVITESKIYADFLPYIKNDYVTPKMFGAVGDGVTDDSDAIQLAIDSNYSVYIPKGVYKCNKSIKLNNLIGKHIIGENGTDSFAGARIVFDECDGFVIDGCTSLVIDNLIIYVSQGFSAIKCPCTENRTAKTIFSNCTFKGSGNGITFDCSSGYNTITNCYFGNTGDYGIGLGINFNKELVSVGINYLYITDNKFGSATVGIKIEECEYCFISRNDFVTLIGIQINTTSTIESPVDYITISENVFFTSSIGIDCYGVARYILSKNNTFNSRGSIAEKYYGDSHSTAPIRIDIDNRYVVRVGEEYPDKLVIIKNANYVNFESRIPPVFSYFAVSKLLSVTGQYVNIVQRNLPSKTSILVPANSSIVEKFSYKQCWKRPTYFITSNNKVDTEYSFDAATYEIILKLINNTDSEQTTNINFIG